jgi:hypothetical protein
MMEKVKYNGKLREATCLYKGKRYERVYGEWTLYSNRAFYHFIQTIADTFYRKRIADGNENYSGSTLHTSVKGRREYKESYNTFLALLQGYAIKYTIVEGYRRAQILLIG